MITEDLIFQEGATYLLQFSISGPVNPLRDYIINRVETDLRNQGIDILWSSTWWGGPVGGTPGWHLSLRIQKTRAPITEAGAGAIVGIVAISVAVAALAAFGITAKLESLAKESPEALTHLKETVQAAATPFNLWALAAIGGLALWFYLRH